MSFSARRDPIREKISWKNSPLIRVNGPRFYAIGDLVDGMMQADAALAEGAVAADSIVGKPMELTEGREIFIHVHQEGARSRPRRWIREDQ